MVETALPSKKIRDDNGRVIGRVRSREHANLFARAEAGMQLLRALVFVDDKRRRNQYALDYIDRQQAALNEARATLLAEKAKLEAAASKVTQTCARYVAGIAKVEPQ